jgi:hypothetical protein
MKNVSDIYTPLNRTSVFNQSDPIAYAWLNFTSIPNTAPNLQANYTEPNGTVYYTTDFLSLPNRLGVLTYSGIYISGHPAASILGNWSVNWYMNGALIFTQQFQITSAAPPVVFISDSAISPNQPGGVNPLNRTLEISNSDSIVYQYTVFAPVEFNHNVTWIWYEPDGVQYTTLNFTITPSDYAVYSYISVAGYVPSTLPGMWTVDVLVDGSLELIQTFLISPGP